MTTKDLHILINQDLQNLTSFAYQDMLPEELDIAINANINRFIELALSKERDGKPHNGFQDTQKKLDDIRELQNKDVSLSPITAFTDGDKVGVFAVLPLDYNHLINDRSIVNITCNIKGVPTITTKVRPNRVIDQEVLPNVLDNFFTKTDKDSPVSNLSGNNIYVYHNPSNFIVSGIIIDYIRTPKKIDFNNFPLVVMEFPDPTCYKIAKMVVHHLSTVTEQNPQKIANIAVEKDD